MNSLSLARRLSAVALLGLLSVTAVHAAPDAKVEVCLTAPISGTIVTAPATVMLTATAQSSQANHPVSKVEFFQGTTLICTATAAPYSAIWSNAPAGRYSLTAKADKQAVVPN